MANFDFNERVLFQLPSDYTCESGVDDNGDDFFRFLKGKYKNDDGETNYEFWYNVSLIEYDPLDSDNVVDGVIEFEKETENSRIVKLSETPKVYIKRLFKSFSIFGTLLYSFELSGQIRLSDCSVLNVSTRKAYTDDESIDELSIIQDFLCVLSSAFIDGRKAPLEKVSAFEIYESLKTNSSPEAKDISPKIRFNINHNGEETSYEFSSDGLKHLDDELFERTEPDEKLYPRYYKAINDPLASLGAVVVRNSTGTDYQFISFSKMIDNGLSDIADPVFRRIKDSDNGNYTLASEAEKYKTVFRVSASAFNEKHDRECEIDEGYIQKDYMLIALRSFAWTLASYCSQYNTEPAQMSFDDFKHIADYCEKHDWLNFNNFSYCKGLCDCGDLHIYYIPDSASDSDRKFIEPSQEDYDRVESMRKTFPNYNEILSEVKSLDKLREDLTYVYPAMAAIHENLSIKRNINEELTGSCADILYAWCAIAKAAKEPFYIEDGPMNCWFSQSEHKTDNSEISKVEQEADSEQQAEENSKNWMRKYGKYLEKNPDIQFTEKKFVFTGFGGHYFDEKSDPVVQKVIQKGGLYRSKVSGVTDYLVVNPKYAGESKMVAVIEQLRKGKTIKVVLQDDLEKALKDKDDVSKNDPSSRTNDNAVSKKSSVSKKTSPKKESATTTKTHPSKKPKATTQNAANDKGNIDNRTATPKTSDEEMKRQKEKNIKRYGKYWAKHLDQYKELTSRKKKLEQKLSEIKKTSETDRKITKLQNEISEIPGKTELLSIDEKIKQLENESDSLGFFKRKKKKALQAQIEQLRVEKKSIQDRMIADKTKLESKITVIQNEKRRKIDSVLKQIDQINYELKRDRSNIEIVGTELFAILKRKYVLKNWLCSHEVVNFYQRDEEKEKGCLAVNIEKGLKIAGVKIYAKDSLTEIKKIVIGGNVDNEELMGEVSKYILDAMNDQPVPIETFTKLFSNRINKKLVIGDFNVSYKTGEEKVKTSFGSYLTLNLSEISIS